MFGRQLRSRFDLLDATVSPPSSGTALDSVVEQKQSSQHKYYHGTRETKFSVDEEVLVRCTKANIKYWIPGVVKKKVGRAVYIIFVPSLSKNVKKHTNQIVKKNVPVSYTDTNYDQPVNAQNLNHDDDLSEFWAFATTNEPSSAQSNEEQCVVENQNLIPPNISPPPQESTHVAQQEEEDDSDCSFSSVIQADEGLSERPDQDTVASTLVSDVQATRSGTDRYCLRNIPKVDYKEN